LMVMPFGKWRDFEDCVRDFMGRGLDEDSAKRLCGYLQAKLGEESSTWTGSIEHREGKIIGGEALHPVETVHPNEWPRIRVYLEDELKRAAGTLVGKPLTLDHIYPLKGRVVEASYGDGALKYVAELDDEKVLEWIRKGVIKRCSVEYEWRSLEKVNGVAPKGITFTGLALLKDFEPGDPETTVEVWEMVGSILEERIKALEEENSSLRRRIKALEEARDGLVKGLGEAVIDPEAKPQGLENYVPKDEIIRELRRAVFERVPRSWGYGPYLQNRRVKALIRRLEGKG